MQTPYCNLLTMFTKRVKMVFQYHTDNPVQNQVYSRSAENPKGMMNAYYDTIIMQSHKFIPTCP
jgi:hypothetical protein